MKNVIITTVLSLFIIGVSAQDYSESNLNTIQSFLTKFQSEAKDQNKEGLLKLIYSMDIENKNTAELIAEKALIGDENMNTDFAYSDKAMNLLKSNHINKFEPISEELKTLLYKNDEFHKVISKRTNEQVAMFDHKGIHIVILLDGENTKLLFWEKLNNLLN